MRALRNNEEEKNQSKPWEMIRAHRLNVSVSTTWNLKHDGLYCLTWDSNDDLVPFTLSKMVFVVAPVARTISCSLWRSIKSRLHCQIYREWPYLTISFFVWKWKYGQSYWREDKILSIRSWPSLWRSSRSWLERSQSHEILLRRSRLFTRLSWSKTKIHKKNLYLPWGILLKLVQKQTN